MNSDILMIYKHPYKFNAKELDDETGLYYYGARYYDPRIGMWLSVDPLTEKMPGWSPYAYAFDNPVRFIDPDGRQGVDWFWDSKKKIFTYDSSITSEQQFNSLKSSGLIEGRYLGKKGNYNVVLGNEIIGRVSLQSDGSWTNMTDSNQSNWEYHDVNNNRTNTQYFTHIDSNRNWGVKVLDNPFDVSLGVEATPISGAGLEFGYFFGNYDHGAFLNIYGTIGFNAGIGLNSTIYESNNGPVTINPKGSNNISGDYSNFQGGIGPLSIGLGGSGIGKYYRTGYKTRSGTINKGISPKFLLNAKSKVGGSYQVGKTYILSNSKND